MRFLRLSLLATTLLLASLSSAGAGPAAKCIFKLDPEIDCPSCEDGIKHVLITAHGVQSADIDVINNRIVVVYDPARINPKALIGRIRVTGYTASEIAK